MDTTNHQLDVRQEIPARPAAEHAGQFDWDYLAHGPEVWEVRIGRVTTPR